jgi:hypothetical protein
MAAYSLYSDWKGDRVVRGGYKKKLNDEVIRFNDGWDEFCCEGLYEGSVVLAKIEVCAWDWIAIEATKIVPLQYDNGY